jgi:uncharacterized membrane protein
MDDRWLDHLTLTTAIAAAVMGGAFFAFSTFIMHALGRLPPAEGVTAMQAINKDAPTPWFMVPLFGTAVAALVLAATSLSRLDDAAGRWRLAGALLYLVAIVLTIAYHVPRNDRLDAADPATPEAARLWADYLVEWTRWNHVRTVAPIAASVALAVARFA